jgi:limonene-1,2-epoxide hydrolase
MNSFILEQNFGKDASNKLAEANDESINGALAALESFYYAFNNKDINALKKVWFESDLSQLNNPLGGIIRGVDNIVKLYETVFKSDASVWVEFGNIVCHHARDIAVFAGEETGEFKSDKSFLPRRIRTSRFFTFTYEKHRWFQIHHHGSIDNAILLQQYQDAVKKH